MPRTIVESGGIDAEQISRLRWYHTIELPGGVLTPGEYDLRPILGRLPIPASLDGSRCLDVGGRDGFYAFEMERRGAAEVVSIDIDDPAAIDFPGPTRPGNAEVQRELDAGNRAFEVARSALASGARRELVPVHRLDPGTQGRFDFAVIGTLLLHLRDPVGALAAIRGVLDGPLLLNEAVVVGVDTLRRRAIAELYMRDAPFWWLCNGAGLRRMVEAAGFRVIESSRPYLVPFGERPPISAIPPLRGSLSGIPRRLVQRRGSLHVWILAEPA